MPAAKLSNIKKLHKMSCNQKCQSTEGYLHCGP